MVKVRSLSVQGGRVSDNSLWWESRELNGRETKAREDTKLDLSGQTGMKRIRKVGFVQNPDKVATGGRVSIDGESEGQQDVDKLPSLAIQQAGR